MYTSGEDCKALIVASSLAPLLAFLAAGFFFLGEVAAGLFREAA
jgi:hypothetical protein